MYAIRQSTFGTRLWGAPLSAAILLFAFVCACGSANAKPGASSATVHTVQACAVKAGKHRGSLRLISTGKRCKRGERRIVWNVLGQRVRRAPSALRAKRARRETPVLEERPVLKGKPEKKVRRAPRGRLGPRAPRVRPAAKVRQGPSAWLTSRSKNWSKRKANRSKR